MKYRGTLDAKVSMRKGVRDPNFRIRVNLNKTNFTPDEKLLIEITPTLDCYISVFSIASDSIGLLFPNRYAKQNFVTGLTSLNLPTSGLAFPVNIPRGWDTAEETIMVVGTKDRNDFVKGGRFSYVHERHAAIMDLVDWLARIEPNSVAEVFERFEIRAE